MILGGESLTKLTRVFSQLIIETNDDHSILRFRNFLKGRSAGGRPVFVDGDAPRAETPTLHEENAAAA
jgi:hypothetical protein